MTNIYCVLKVESREFKIFKAAFKKEDVRHDDRSREGGGRRVNAIMTLIFSQTVWMFPLMTASGNWKHQLPFLVFVSNVTLYIFYNG